MHSGLFDREYFCHNCHLQYAGFSDTIKGREPCPHCNTPDPCAVDTFANCYCWISNVEVKAKQVKRGRDAWEETVWWREDWMKPEWLEFYRNLLIPNDPRPEALKYWKNIEKAYIRRLFAKK